MWDVRRLCPRTARDLGPQSVGAPQDREGDAPERRLRARVSRRPAVVGPCALAAAGARPYERGGVDRACRARHGAPPERRSGMGARRADALGPSISLVPPPVDSRLPSPVLVSSRSSAAIRHRPRDCKSVRTRSGRASRARRASSMTPRSHPRPRPQRSRSATPRSASPVRPPSWRCCVTCSTPSPIPPNRAGQRSNACSARHHPVETHPAITIRSSPATAALHGAGVQLARNLHDHHLRFRSRAATTGATTAPWSAPRIICMHPRRTIHASGVAPHAIEWRLGVRLGVPPFLAYVGDRYCLQKPPPTAINATRRTRRGVRSHPSDATSSTYVKGAVRAILAGIDVARRRSERLLPPDAETRRVVSAGSHRPERRNEPPPPRNRRVRGSADAGSCP